MTRDDVKDEKGGEGKGITDDALTFFRGVRVSVCFLR